MVIDILFVSLLLMALIKGYRKGFIIAVFSFLSIIIGLAAGIKLSVVAANWLQNNTSVNPRWLPALSFILVMLLVGFLVRWCALLIEKTFELAMMGFINKLAGILLYAALYHYQVERLWLWLT